MTRTRWARLNWICLKWTRKGYASTDYNLMNFFSSSWKSCWYGCVKRGSMSSSYYSPADGKKCQDALFLSINFQKESQPIDIWIIFFSSSNLFFCSFFFIVVVEKKRIASDDMATLEYWIAQTKHILVAILLCACVLVRICVRIVRVENSI